MWAVAAVLLFFCPKVASISEKERNITRFLGMKRVALDDMPILTITIFDNIMEVTNNDIRYTQNKEENKENSYAKRKISNVDGADVLYSSLFEGRVLRNGHYGKVEEMTKGRVRVGPGTLYNLLEQFEASGFINETKVEGRRRSYLLTEKGRDILKEEYERLKTLVTDYEQLF